MQDRNADAPADHRIEFRVGIDLGDIIIDGDDIFGDGVNVAARLESIAEPGGICISSSAYDQVRDKLELRFIDLGEQTLKNIARPTRAYAVVRDGPGERGSSITPSPAAAPPKACDRAVRCGTAVSGTRDSGIPTANPAMVARISQRW